MNEKYYFINKLETNIIDRLDKETTVIYRDYSLKQINEELVKKIKIYCKKKQIKFYLSNNFKLAVKLDLDGAYIPSFNHNTNHLAFSYKKKFDVIGSAHNLKEIRVKEKQNVKRIFLSSLFKKNKNYLGINKYKLLSNLTNKKVVALGGISKNNMKKLMLLKNYCFAGISFFE